MPPLIDDALKLIGGPSRLSASRRWVRSCFLGTGARTSTDGISTITRFSRYPPSRPSKKAFPVWSMLWKKNLTQSRKEDAKNTAKLRDSATCRFEVEDPARLARGSLKHWIRLFPQTTNPKSKEPPHDTASSTHDRRYRRYAVAQSQYGNAESVPALHYRPGTILSNQSDRKSVV